MQRAVDSENAENLHEQSRRFGTTVLYGDLVQVCTQSVIEIIASRYLFY